ncbi:MAG: UDP-N-acetylmuramoyl-L-alanine--D-glutamate ligase [Rhodocyclaceae bacterium]|nr:UDP-N-acetylmuramoyl-L-alanine--D-glutamate ligase [Rhodocyclaceae bacterium]MBP6109485.1 UDP-N-acetylmuramoyl-L-alanine--D-glutamate ligase [Rhodocyclaceae bacterium]MBP6278621.1 UDP-N-acetylmuramoyl-L-alanine--D-glutamate ligase [Rhodocyclaceae bacterium]
MLANKHVLVLGLGESGFAAALWCCRQGARVRVADTRTAPPYLAVLQQRVATPRSGIQGVQSPGTNWQFEFIAGEFDKSLLVGIDILVLSPGLSGGLMVVIHARAAGIPVIGEIELFAQGLRELAGTKSVAPVIAITGTNGKTTTTALTGHLLAAIGQRVGVAGNISPAALTALMEFQDNGALPDVWVLELSSFQLETTESLAPSAATVLNISDDHLDRYIDLNDYASTKARVFQGDGVQVINRQDSRVKRMMLAGRKAMSFGLDAPTNSSDFGLQEVAGSLWIMQGEQALLPVDELAMSGLHNAANAMAALALCCALGFDATRFVPALKSFKGLPHRVEKIAEMDGVDWYDDSKGTNVGATVAALEGLQRKVVVILGGDGKGQDFSYLTKAVKRHARAVVLIGRDGPLIEKTLVNCGVLMESASDMSDAVKRAKKLAQRGDAVLLSPACASYDMYRNYEHRAQVFVAAVKELS